MSREKPKTPTTKGIARAKRQQKLVEAQKRKEDRSSRSHKEQLKVLDKRLGKRQGAHRERERLTELIKMSKTKKAKQN